MARDILKYARKAINKTPIRYRLRISELEQIREIANGGKMFEAICIAFDAGFVAGSRAGVKV